MIHPRLIIRCTLILLLIGIIPGLAAPVAAQETVEELARRTHLQNLRTTNYTFWIGGNLGDPARAPRDSVVGQVLDDWQFASLNDDPAVAAADLTRPVLLNFWASWCPPCRLEFPHLTAVALAPEDHEFDVLFVNTADRLGDALAYLGAQDDAIHTVLDENNEYGTSWHIDSIPTSLLLNTDGTVLIEHVGIMTPTVTTFFDAVAANPGAGEFDAANAPLEPPEAVLLPFEPESAAPIAYGDEIAGTITEDDTQQEYRFEGHAGDAVTVEMRAQFSDLDTYIVLMTADGTRLAENDDADDITTDSHVQATLPTDGMYIVIATRFLEAEGFSDGDYVLALNAANAAPPGSSPSQTDDTLQYGDRVSGTISDENYEDRWHFTGQRGDVITITMERTQDEMGGLDGYLMLLGPDGNTLIEVDDSPGSVMPAIEEYELPADGEYVIVATRFGFANGFSTGDYTLTLSAPGIEAAAPGGGTTAPTPMPEEAQPIGYNSAVTGSISDEDYEDWYIFRGSAGDVITIRMNTTAGNLDTYLTLLDANGVELISADDSEGSSDAAISDYELPAAGRYVIRATRYGFVNGPSSGEYRLVIETDVVPPPAEAEPPGELSFGAAQSGTLDMTNPGDSYVFTGRAGEIITLGVERRSGDLNPALGLRGPDGQVIAANTEWGSAGEARLHRVPLPADGTYTADVLLDDPATSGDYQVLLLRAAEVETPAGSFIPAEGLDLEIVLVWDSGADLALDVGGPTPGEITHRANDGCAAPAVAPLERLIWSEGSAPPGLYTITVRYAFDCAGDSAPVTFMLIVAQRGEVVRLFTGTLAHDGDRYITFFEVRP